MATVTFSAADDVLYAYLAGEIDHDAAQGLRIQLVDNILVKIGTVKKAMPLLNILPIK